jgi:6-phosphogluconolactonase
MKSPKASVLIRENEDLASQSAADLFVCAAIRSVRDRGVFQAAISGGKSPRGMYQRLAESQWSLHVPWEHTHIFFTDERCVPPDHEDSNYKLAEDLLLSRVPIPPENVHRFPAELPPEEAADRYENEIRSQLGHEPHFDLIVLGMGTDTHTASLFPNSPALEETRRLAVANWVEKLSTNRLTLTIPVLNAAREALILAFGESKAEPVRTAIQGDTDVHAHPVQAIRPANSRLIWILDHASASEL